MARRLTVAEAKITGADIKNPKRHQCRADPPVRGLGEPPQSLSDEQRAAWVAFAEELPWLAASDRMIVELTSMLCVMVRQPGCPLGVYAQLRLCLSSLGGTPVDRSRVGWDSDKPDDPVDEFLN